MDDPGAGCAPLWLRPKGLQHPGSDRVGSVTGNPYDGNGGPAGRRRYRGNHITEHGGKVTAPEEVRGAKGRRVAA